MKSPKEIQDRLTLLSMLVQEFEAEKDRMYHEGKIADALSNDKIRLSLAMQHDAIKWVIGENDLEPSQMIKERTQ